MKGSVDTAVLILAGGRSTRFGQDKAEVLVDGMRSLDRVHEAVQGVGPVWVSGAVRKMAEPVTGFIPDEVADKGPLHALICCLEQIPEPRILVVCCDQPWLTQAAIKALMAPLSDGYVARMPVVEGHRLVLTALYDRAVLAVFQQAWARGTRSPTRALEPCQVEELSESALCSIGLGRQVFTDFDVPDDLVGPRSDHQP